MKNARGLKLFLQGGGIIAYPTESCFGLGCDPKNRSAVKRLLRLKGRPQHKGLILIAACQRQLKPYMQPVSTAQQQLLNASWPGAHTWLVPAAKNCPPWLSGRHTSIAVRVTAHRSSADLCRRLNMALVSTSANHSGGKAAKTAHACRQLFAANIRIINGHIGKNHKPSTIQDLTTGRIIRA
ncbi:MAG: Sua5/YciO/YrdC/YwlC family protein [Methylophilaceae bacterium]